MANTFTQELINALAAINACTPDEQIALAQYIIGKGKSTPAQVNTPAPAPIAEAPKPLPDAHDYDVELRLIAGTSAITHEARGNAGKCVNAVLREAGFVKEANFERPEVYAKDYTGKDGVFHAKGTHKMGAWVLRRKDGKMDKAGALKFHLDHQTIHVSAEQVQAKRDASAERKARKAQK